MWEALLFFAIVVGGAILVNKLFPNVKGGGG